MNSATSCHEIPDCPGLYVDAFRGKYLTNKTKDPEHVFILTHYHGDHYQNLPKEQKYQGPARIHCTPVTASLLRVVHEVPEIFVVEHGYGESWSFQPKMAASTPGADSGSVSSSVKITFYDANHCPGAAMVVVELDEGKIHLHTGDMRYHEKMKSYPILKEAALNRRIECVLLDTTYGNPKHDFIPQETAVESIAAQVKELLCCDNGGNDRTLVLLSCYSIGKERVLFEASMRANQPVYVTERKLRMLQCIQGDKESQSSQMVHRCTLDPEKSDIHVVPMGKCGELWPFFQPNFAACAEYANDLTKAYVKVVAFIPTGWAEASNWNKKNAISQSHCDGLDVEIRLVSYSEHSAFSELQAFVQFLNPRKIIPTVFKDENEKRRIEARFPVDSGRAKQHFINSMTTTTTTSAGSSPVAGGDENNNKVTAVRADGDRKRKLPGEQQQQQQQPPCNIAGIASLEAMGFETGDARAALEACQGNVEAAVESLLLGAQKGPPKRTPPKGSPSAASSLSNLPKGEQQTIHSFFSRK